MTQVAHVPQSMHMATPACPRFHAAEFANPNTLASWLNSQQGYHLVFMTPLTTTNHFSKETETVVWAVIERDEDKA